MPAEGMTIDELARRASTTTRSVRLYRERNLLPPPDRLGRSARYHEGHLARLRLIVDLLHRGYSLGAISEVVSVWQRGGGVSDLIGLEDVISRPWSDEPPGWITVEELARMFPAGPDELVRAVEIGLVEPDVDGFRVPSPRLLHAGAELIAAGVPVTAVLDQAETLFADLQRIAHRFLDLALEHVFKPFLANRKPAEDIPRVRDLIDRLRPLATDSVHAALAQVMAKTIADQVADLVDELGPTEIERRLD